MALPSNKQELADWILRRLGAPVVNVEVTDSQLEDVIDEAVQWYQNWHFDGAERTYRTIKIDSSILDGNNRASTNVNVPVYDPTKDSEYRIGDRVMTLASSGADKIWVKYDSEEKVSRNVYTVDPTGIWYANQPQDNPGLTDSDNGFILYDSDLHNEFVYISSETGAWVDSEGTFVLYDSDKHSNFIYSKDSESGLWVDSDGTGSWVLYDSDIHTYPIFVLDSEGDYIDSDGGIVVWDSENYTHNLNRYRIDTTSPQRWSRATTKDVRFNRHSEPKGTRYSRDSEVQYRINYTFKDLWKYEMEAQAEVPTVIDYTKAGQVGIPLPEEIIGVSKIFRIDNFSGMGMWNYEYQYFLNNFDFFYGNGGASQMPMTNYLVTKQYLGLIDDMMNVQPAIRFNKHKNRVYIDTNWTRIKNMAKSKNYYLMMECYEVTDPEVFGDVYKDMWLKRYATALAKEQWGSNMKKYTNTELPGGLMIDGQALYDEAKEEKEALEEELKASQLEIDFFIG